MTIGERPLWASPMVFVLAAAGSAVGLGNIWKFPYVTGIYGGGAFVLVYLLTIAAVGLPLMAAEILIGKTTAQSPIRAFIALRGRRTPWRWIGVLGVLAAFIILSYYSVVAGWTLHYLFLSAGASFSSRTPEAIAALFPALYEDASLNLAWHFVVMFVTTWIVFRGLKGGIEWAVKLMMPALGLLLMVLVVNSLFLPGAMQGLAFLFRPDFSQLSGKAVLEAVGQGFFSLSLGMGCMITYGSYLRRESNLAKPAAAIVFFDTLIAIMAGVVIFPIVFSFGTEPAAGPGLVFITLPKLFAQMPGGNVLAPMFFLLLFFAALTSAISLLEVVTSCLVDSKLFSRKAAALSAGTAVFLLGVLPALSGGVLKDVLVPGFSLNVFDSFDAAATNWLLPFGGILIAVFTAWALPDKLRREEFERAAPWWWIYGVWLFLVRWVTPIGVTVVFLRNLGWI